MEASKLEIQRIALVAEFDGRLFHGWQRQDNALAVQAVIEDALAKIEGQEVKLVAAGRTDAGVHATAMLVHADVSLSRWQRSARAYTQGINRLLPEGICIIGVRAVANGFHARFDCLERRYRYQIWNRSTPPAIERWRHWWVPREIDVDAMAQASEYLVGAHDFSAFRASGCQAANALREVRHIEVRRRGWEIAVAIHADAFLYHMVRNIIGSLVLAGTGAWNPEKIKAVLQAKDRSLAGATAPAHGLYFTDALYAGFASSQLIGNESNEEG